MEQVRRIDVLVIGAGPAGSTCGCLLKQAGINCIVVDQAVFPREKLCGGGLSPKAWHLLGRLLPDFQYDYLPVTKIRFQYENDPVCEFDSEIELRMVDRKIFDNALLQHYIKKGGEFMNDSFLSFEEQEDRSLLVSFKSGKQISCRYLVAADGANSRVRRQILGSRYEHNTLFLEQYVPFEGRNDIYAHYSSKYGIGSFYFFPGPTKGIWGFRDDNPTPAKFRQLLEQAGIKETQIKGANIPVEAVESGKDTIILIGDAGGFANKIHGEGLFDAFLTASNAYKAIKEQRPFRETNVKVFEKMKTQGKLRRFGGTKFGLITWRFVLKHPRICKYLFDIKMKRETFRASK